MSDYERSTVLSTRQVLQIADEIFPQRADLARGEAGRHGAAYSGGEGTLELEVHRHGLATVVVARTDQLRTSKIDDVVRYFMNQLPYQHGDPPRE